MSVLINASTSTGLVQSADTSGEIELQSNGTTALKVNTNEGIQILNCLGVGNATPSTSGAGITFPATQSASTDANTLDDYEEGTWTPSVTASSGSFTTVTTSGQYVKIGKQVTVNFRFVLTSVGTGANAIFVSNFPFVARNGTTLSGCTREDVSSGWACPASPTGDTSIVVSKYDGSSAIGSGYGFSFCISYITA